jgi:hypothetical protein
MMALKRAIRACLTALLLGNVAFAGQTYRERSVAMLRGLSGVYIEVSPFRIAADAPDSQPEQTIQLDVERELREAGIVVLSKEAWQKAPGKPVLRVEITSRRKARCDPQTRAA